MTFYPYNTNLGQTQQTDAPGTSIDRAFLSHYQVAAADAVVADTDAVHAAVTDTGEEVEVTTEITNPGVPRNITATAGGTAADIGAIQVVIEGTNFAGETITETLPAFTVNTAGSVVGSKAFATVTSITIPAHDGVAATTAIGFGDKLGLPDKLSHNTVLMAFVNNTLETTAPTVTVDADNVEGNTFDLDSALSGTVVDVYYIA